MKAVSLFIFIAALLGTGASAQAPSPAHSSVMVWTPSGCNACQSFLGPVMFANGDRLFVEELDSTDIWAYVDLVREGNSFVAGITVAVAAHANRGMTIGNLTENVTIEVNDSDMVLHPLPYADPVAGPDEREKRFNPSTIMLNPGEHVRGYLFFPHYDSIESLVVVLKTPQQSFRFPFRRHANFRSEFVAPPAQPSVRAREALTQIPAPEQTTGNRVSFACADEFGVHLCVPEWVSKWVKANREKFPTLSFSEAPVSNGRNYLVVFSSSESAFSGFDAIVMHSTSTSTVPVTGTGTVVDNGYVWTFTFNGMARVTTTTTTDESVPYTIETKTSFVRVYDGHGALISEHRRRVSTKQGGDAAGSIGYNSVAIMSGIIRRNSVLLNETMKDILKNLR